jgi:hypothetical protein
MRATRRVTSVRSSRTRPKPPREPGRKALRRWWRVEVEVHNGSSDPSKSCFVSHEAIRYRDIVRALVGLSGWSVLRLYRPAETVRESIWRRRRTAHFLQAESSASYRNHGHSLKRRYSTRPGGLRSETLPMSCARRLPPSRSSPFLSTAPPCSSPRASGSDPPHPGAANSTLQPVPSHPQRVTHGWVHSTGTASFARATDANQTVCQDRADVHRLASRERALAG